MRLFLGLLVCLMAYGAHAEDFRDTFNIPHGSGWYMKKENGVCVIQNGSISTIRVTIDANGPLVTSSLPSEPGMFIRLRTPRNGYITMGDGFDREASRQIVEDFMQGGIAYSTWMEPDTRRSRQLRYSDSVDLTRFADARRACNSRP